MSLMVRVVKREPNLQMLVYLQKTSRESSVNRKSLDINLYIKDLRRIVGLQGVLRHRRLLSCLLSEDHQRYFLCKKTPRVSHVYRRSSVSKKTAFSLKNSGGYLVYKRYSENLPSLLILELTSIGDIQRVSRSHKISMGSLVYRITTFKKTFTEFSTHRRIIESPLSIEFLQRILYPWNTSRGSFVYR